MPALRPTPTTASLVRRQPIDLGGVAQDAGAGLGGAVQSGAAGAGGVAATAASGAGGAIETVSNAPNAAISAGTGALGDKIVEGKVDQLWEYVRTSWYIGALGVGGFLLTIGLTAWGIYQKRNKKTFFGQPRGDLVEKE